MSTFCRSRLLMPEDLLTPSISVHPGPSASLIRETSFDLAPFFQDHILIPIAWFPRAPFCKLVSDRLLPEAVSQHNS